MIFSRDVLAGVIILGLSAFLWYLTTTFEADLLGMTQGMSAEHMPRLILGVIVGLTFIMIGTALIKGAEPLGGIPPWQMMATVALLGTAALMFTTLGLPIVFFLVCLCLPIIWGARNFAGIALFAACVPVAIYVVFKLILGLRLPMGPLSALGL